MPDRAIDWRLIFVPFFCYATINAFLSPFPALAVTGEILFYFALPITAATLASIRDRRDWLELRSEFRPSVLGIAFSLLLAFVAIGVSERAGILLRPFLAGVPFALPIMPSPSYFEAILRPDASALVRLFGVIYIAVTAGFVEEVVFKPVLFRCRRSWSGEGQFVAVSALLFALVHFEQGLLRVVLIGTVFGIPTALYYWRTREFGHLVGFHVLTDLLVFGLAH